MTKKLLILLFLFSSLNIFAQKQKNPKLDWIKESDTMREKKQIRAEIILKNEDTLKTHIKVRTNLFDSTLLDEHSINKVIKSITNGVIIKYSAEEIKKIRFIDFKNNERVFVAFSDQLAELLFDGKIEWTRLHSSSGFIDILTNKRLNQFVMLSVLNNNRNQLRKITILRPDLLPLIDSMSLSFKDIFILLEKYNE